LIQLLLILIGISQSSLSICNVSGFPVTGASVCADSTLIGITDSIGEVSLPYGTDSVEVRAMGYVSWTGAVPRSGNVFLSAVAVPSGMIMLVTGSRGRERDILPATTVLARDDMEYLGKSGLNALSSRCSGVYAREYGGAMPVLSISIRGSDAAHSEYYIDGHDIGGSMDGLPGITLDPSLFGGMEVSRGGGSGFLKCGMAGTLNFVAESPDLPPRASLTFADNHSISFSSAASIGKNRISLSARRLKGMTGSTAHDGNILLNGSISPFRYGILTSLSSGETESPDWTVPTDATRRRLSVDGWGRWNAGYLSISADFRAGRHEYRSTQPSITEDTHDELSSGLALDYAAALSAFDLGFKAGSSYDRVNSTSLGRRDRLTAEAAFALSYSGPISISSSVSLSAAPSPMTGAFLSAGLPVLDSLLLLHASASCGFRRPSLNDLYWPEDNFAEGNPDLLPETSREFEAGVTLNTFRNIRFAAAVFTAITDDLIRWEPGESGKWSPVNISEAIRRGIEAEAWFIEKPFEVSASLTLLEVKDNCAGSVNYGKKLPYTPDYTFGIRAGIDLYSWAHCSITAGGMGIRFKNYSETSWMPSYTVLSTGIDLHPEFMGEFSVNASIGNLLDEEYQETSGYAGKPRTLYFGIEWNAN